jgi:hypothetical protein
MSPTRCSHGNILCRECAIVTDAAKRFSGNVNALITFSDPWEIRRSWIAVKLEDGGYDGTIYDSRADAIKHQSDERLCCYFPIGNFANGLSELDAQLILDLQRHAYDAGMRITDESTPDVFPSIGQVDVMRAWQRYNASVRN